MKTKKTTKERNERFVNLKNTFYAIKTIHRCAPLLLTSFILTQTAFWFFTGFIQEILFLKLLLSLIESGGSYKEYVLLVLMFAASGLLAKATDCFTDYLVCTRMKHFYKNLNDRIFKKAVSVDMACLKTPSFMTSTSAQRKSSQTTIRANLPTTLQAFLQAVSRAYFSLSM